VESIIAGVKIKADPEFRLVATMNEDASTYNLPGYIESRLKPVVTVKTPTEKEIFDIIQLNIPYASKELLHSILQYLKSVKDTDDTYEFSIRDAINITKYALKLQRKGEFNIEKAAQCIIHSAGAPHVW
jgi:MoxR-like ATPase